VLYNVDSLVQYILATGDFSEPQTRIPFSDDDLHRIDAEVHARWLAKRRCTLARITARVVLLSGQSRQFGGEERLGSQAEQARV